jgi:hypothetical protein
MTLGASRASDDINQRRASWLDRSFLAPRVPPCAQNGIRRPLRRRCDRYPNVGARWNGIRFRDQPRRAKRPAAISEWAAGADRLPELERLCSVRDRDSRWRRRRLASQSTGQRLTGMCGGGPVHGPWRTRHVNQGGPAVGSRADWRRARSCARSAVHRTAEGAARRMTFRHAVRERTGTPRSRTRRAAILGQDGAPR